MCILRYNLKGVDYHALVPIKRFITYIMANVSKLHSLRYIRLLTQFYDTYCVSVCEQMDLMKYALYSLRLYLITCMISMTLLFSYTSKPLYQVFETMFNTVFSIFPEELSCRNSDSVNLYYTQNYYILYCARFLQIHNCLNKLPYPRHFSANEIHDL